MLGQQIDEMAKQLQLGYTHFVIRTELASTLAKMKDAFDMAPVFFVMTLNSHRGASILGLTRVLDRDKDCLALDSISRCLHSNAGCFPRISAQDVRSVRKQFDENATNIRQRAQKIVKLRDREIAHLNHDLALGKPKLPNNDNLRPDIEWAYKEIRNALDEVSEACLGKKKIGSLGPLCCIDFKPLLEAVDDALKAKERELARSR